MPESGEAMSDLTAIEVRDAVLPHDGEAVRRLWLDYLTWGNDEMQARHGVHPHSPREAVEADMRSIAKFQPPDGRLVLAFRGEEACGVGCLRRIGDHTAEIKRMYVDPTLRRAGAGRAILEHLLAAAEAAGYTLVRLDSPKFMTAAHALYRSHGFVDIEPYIESEIPDEFKPYLIFMERSLVRSTPAEPR
jgi:ribosomal protein S18 acetylase RimI-like enzyme